jgi:hypothetical protein
MKNLISTFLISLVNISLFGFLARITDLFIQDCEWKCTIWFFFGIMCALSINYFVRNFRS